jgi:integrase
MRPEEVCSIRMVDIDMSYARCWIYVPLWHKNLHRGIQRRIPIGPIGQELIKPYMVGRAMDQPLFSPREAVRERRGKMPRQRIGFAYDTRSYRQAIWLACDKAFPMPDGADRKAWLREHRWSPNRLRKLSLDGIEQQFGKQAAKAYAGHSRVETTQDFYLTQDDSLARSVAEKVG